MNTMTPDKRQPTKPLVTIVVPAKDEEEAIGDTLAGLPLATLEAMGHDTEVVVLDGRSQDATAQIARDWGASVLTDRQEGKGAALRHARDRFNGDVVVMLDADGTYAPDAIPRVVARLDQTDADIVMGHRRILPGAMKPSHRAGNMLLTLEARALYLSGCPDLCTGLWGFRSATLRALPLKSQGFELEADMFAMANRLGLHIETVDVDYLPRDGDPKLCGLQDGFRIAWWLVRSRFIPLPDEPRLPPPAGDRGPHPRSVRAPRPVADQRGGPS